MLLNGNDTELLAYDRRQKYFNKGQKLYAARVRFLKTARYLRKRFPTASEAERYGPAVIERYKNILKAKEAVETFLKSYVFFRLGPFAVIWVRGEWIKGLWPHGQKPPAARLSNYKNRLHRRSKWLYNACTKQK